MNSLTTTLICLSVAGCSAPNAGTAAGHVSLSGASGDYPVRVLAGRHWVVPSAQSVLVSPRGDFRVPRNSEAVTAFVDVNHNGRLEALHEPSAWCVVANEGWWCEIQTEPITLLHASSTYGDNHIDTNHVYSQSFQDDWSINEDLSMCTQDGQCAELSIPSFANTNNAVLTLNACQHDWSKPLSIVRSSSAKTANYAIEAPLSIVTNLSAWRQENGSVTLLGTSEPQPDRFVFWLGEVDQDLQLKTSHWTSEQALVEETGPSQYSTTIPAHELAKCDDCAIGFQAIRRSGDRRITLLSEGRTVISNHAIK